MQGAEGLREDSTTHDGMETRERVRWKIQVCKYCGVHRRADSGNILLEVMLATTNEKMMTTTRRIMSRGHIS